MSKISPRDHNPIPKTLSETIYNHLKEAIIDNKLKADQRINEKEIAARFNVSATPVREAVLKLGAEGFVRSNSHKNAFVKEISYTELKEIFQVLAFLDSLAAPQAVDKLTSADLRTVAGLTSKMERLVSSRSIDKYMSLNNSIHYAIWEAVPNRVLAQTLNTLHEQLLRYSYARIQAFRKPGVLQRSLEEHQQIKAALEEKDKNLLKSLMAAHWGSLLQPSPFEEGLKENIRTKERG